MQSSLHTFPFWSADCILDRRTVSDSDRPPQPSVSLCCDRESPEDLVLDGTIGPDATTTPLVSGCSIGCGSCKRGVLHSIGPFPNFAEDKLVEEIYPATHAHSCLVPFGNVLAICKPRSPAKRSVNGSESRASDWCVSRALK